MKNKGFTLIEVLAAVVILGIISVTGGLAISKIIQNAREEHYVTAEKTLEAAAQDFVQKNRGYLPKYIGQKTEVTLDLLITNKYIEPIKDYQGETCSRDRSKVIIFKYSQTGYQYTPYLECSSHKTQLVVKGLENVTSIDRNYSNSTTAEFRLADSDKLISYSYVVYVGTREVKNSGSLPLTSYPTSCNVKATYTQRPTKIVVSATDIYGNSFTKTFTGF